MEKEKEKEATDPAEDRKNKIVMDARNTVNLIILKVLLLKVLLLMVMVLEMLCIMVWYLIPVSGTMNM